MTSLGSRGAAMPAFIRTLRARTASFGSYSWLLGVVGALVLGVGILGVRDLRDASLRTRAMYESSMAGLDLLNELQY